MSSHFQVVTIDDLVTAVRRQQGGLAALAWAPPDRPGEVTLCIHGAHPGAGASTVAVALTDVLPGLGNGCATLVDLANDAGFGASEAMQARTDLGLRGWTGGIRGPGRIVQPVVGEEMTEDAGGDVVIDVCDQGWGFDLDVLVCRATVPSVRRAESVLMEQPARVVAVVGATKWPSPVRSSLGPHLHAASTAGGVVFFPREASLEVNGLTADPLPAITLRAAGRLLDFLGRDGAIEAEADQNGGLP
jgi:hypothetical protein